MSFRLSAPLDLDQNELRRAVIENLSAAPASPVAGRIYFDTTLAAYRYYNGTTWLTVLTTGSYVTTTHDLNNVWTIIDQNIGTTSIAATSAPGAPQYIYTVGGGSLPSHADVANYDAYLGIYGKNTDSSTRTINWRFTKNGSDIGSGSSSQLPTTASPYWFAVGQFAASAIAPGDVLGIKMWGSVTNVIDYRGALILIVPRDYNLPDAGDLLASCFGDLNSVALSGALSGVTYTTPNGSASVGVHHATLGTTLIAGNATPASVFPPSYFSGAGAGSSGLVHVDSNNRFTGIAAVPTIATLIIPRYFLTRKEN